jgi:Ulp1 family protease
LARFWPVAWLNDEGVNEYLALVNTINPDILCMNSFFFEKLKTATTSDVDKSIVRFVNKALK